MFEKLQWSEHNNEPSHLPSSSCDSDDMNKNPKNTLLKQLEYVACYNVCHNSMMYALIRVLLYHNNAIIRITLSTMGDETHGKLDDERQTQLDIKCLQILRATIHNQIVLIDEEDKERNPKQFQK